MKERSKYFRQYVIYQLLNTFNGKKYIGCTSNYTKRKARHRCRLNAGVHVNRHLQSAWNKYGQEVFEFSVVQILDNREAMFELEADLIDHLSERFYNLHEGGCGGSSWDKSSKNASLIIAKISAAHKGKPKSAEHKAKLSKAKSKPCSVLGVEYPSKKEAVKITGINDVTMWTRLKSDKYPDYYYL